jgi:hypothetical protein
MLLACLRGESAVISSSDLKRHMTESIRDLVRRIDHVFHSERDQRAKMFADTLPMASPLIVLYVTFNWLATGGYR